MKPLRLFTIVLCLCGLIGCHQAAPTADKPPITVDKPREFHVLVMAEKGGIHAPFVAAAKVWLASLAAEQHLTLDYIENAQKINAEFLSKYQLFLQLNYPPYGWGPTAEAAFQQYMTEGRGGWVGLHHASLLGDFDGYHVWPWYDDFMGGILWKAYIPKFASGKVNAEDRNHPVMKGLPPSFVIKAEEWYTYDKSPRAKLRVLASVDESSYVPDGKVKMGDHPVIWTNDHIKARNVYIFMGHTPALFDDDVYKAILKNAILWAAGQN